MQKIVLLTRNFPPLQGGMERLNYHLYAELKQVFAVSVVGPEGSEYYLEPETPHCQFPHKPLFSFLWISFFKSFYFCLQQKPALIIAGSGATALTARIVAWLTRSKVVVFVHGLDLVANNLFYQKLFLPAIRRADAVWVNSRNTCRIAVKQGICQGKIQILHPGVTLPDVGCSLDPALFKAEYGIAADKKILLSVGRLTERKGLAEFLQYSFKQIVKRDPRFVLVIIGCEPENALQHKAGVLNKLLEIIQAEELGEHVVFLGHVSDTQLHKAYAGSYLLVFPGIEMPGDVEGFGMVAIEAAAYGLPTVAFSVGGVPDAINPDLSGWLIPAGDYAAMTETLLNGCEDPEAFHAKVNSESCRKHAASFSWSVFGNKLIQLCLDVIDNKANFYD